MVATRTERRRNRSIGTTGSAADRSTMTKAIVATTMIAIRPINSGDAHANVWPPQVKTSIVPTRLTISRQLPARSNGADVVRLSLGMLRRTNSSTIRRTAAVV